MAVVSLLRSKISQMGTGHRRILPGCQHYHRAKPVRERWSSSWL